MMSKRLIAVALLFCVLASLLGPGRALYAGLVRQVRPVPATVTVKLVESPAVCGDQNRDGVVNIVDVIINLQIAVGLVDPTPTQKALGDLNRDASVDVLDAITALRYIVGLRPMLDACGPPVPD